MANNIVDKIDSTITVWTKDGNAMENRTLLTLDTYGLVVTGCGDAGKAVFVPWNKVNYVDYPNDQLQPCQNQSAIGFAQCQGGSA